MGEVGTGPSPRWIPRRYRSLWRLRPWVAPYDRQMILMFGCALAGVMAGVVIPLIIEAVVDGPIRRGERGQLLPLFAAALALGAAEAVLILGRRWIQSVTVVRVEASLRGGLYAHLQRLPVAFHDHWQTGQLLSRATTDLSTIRRFLGFGAIFLLVNALQYVVVVAILLTISVPLGALVALGTLPVLVLAKRFGHGYALVSRRVQDQQGDLATQVEEAATGIRVTKALGRQALVQENFARSAATLRESSLRSVLLRGRFWGLLELVPNLTMAAVVVAGGYAVADHTLPLGALVAFTTLLVLLQWPVIDLGWLLASAQEAATAADRVFEVLDAARAVADRPGAVPLLTARGELAFRRVAFRYPSGSGPVLRDVSLTIEPGETVALVGATGSGKSTLTFLPPRLYDVSGGAVTVDGHDVRELTLDSLRSRVATAFEEPVLFSMSVRENLTLGRPDATAAQIEEALELAQATFAFTLPWGLQTRIGEQGLLLSGGQRQRLALARAVLTRPSVLVLDDPLSALDVATEALVERALATLLRDTTGLLVVHRPSTVALADRVALLEEGRITAVGTHHELMSLDSYRLLLSTQVPDAPPGLQPDGHAAGSGARR